MKLGTQTAFFFAAMILGVIISLSGCAKTGMDLSAKTNNTMESMEKDYKNALAQIDTTKASLEALVKPGQRNAQRAFKKYSADVDKMESLGNRLLDHGDKMRAEGKEYFAEWEKQGDTYTNPDIQALSEQRRADLSDYFVNISEANVGIRGAFKAYMSDIREIQTYLSNDLTPKGVESITPIAQKAVSDGNDLKKAVAPVLDAIGGVRRELTPSGK